MKKISVYSMLFKKALKDLRSNWKQFISIVFIIGLAVTLFVGLQANHLSLKTRIDDLYNRGNIASYFMTYAMVDDQEERIVNDLLPFHVDTNQRMQISAQIEGKGINLAISDTYPTVSKAYELLEDGTSNDDLYHSIGNTPADEQDFFIIDKSIFKFLNQDPSRDDFDKKYKIGDEIELSISISSFKDVLLNNFDTVFDSYTSALGEEDSVKIKDIMKTYLTSYFEENPSLDFKTKYTNYMLHPENVAADNTTNTLSLMGRKTSLNLINPIIKDALTEIKALFEQEGVSQTNAVIYYIEKLCKTLTNSSNQILIKVSDKQYLPATKRILESYYDGKTYEEGQINNRLIYMTNLENLTSNLTVANDIDQANSLSLTFPMIFLLVAVLISITTISQLIIKERQQIGTFKALGLTKFEIVSHYLMITFFISLIGIIFGIFFGPFLLPKIMDIKYKILYTIPATSYSIPVLVSVLTALVVLAVVGFITWFIVNKELRITPVESMRPAVPKIKFKGKNAAKPKQIRFMSLRIALRNIKVYFTKSIMVIIGICGCTGLLVCGFGVDNTLDNGVQHDIHTFFNYDIMTTYTNYSANNNDLIISNSLFEGKFDEDRCYNMSVLPTNYYVEEGTTFTNTAYILPQKIFDDGVFKLSFPINTVAIAKSSSENLSVKVGDSISFKILEKTYTREIGLIYDDFYVKSIIIHSEDTINGTEMQELSDKYVTAGYLNFKTDLSDEEVNAIIEEIMNMNLGISTCISLKLTVEKVNSIVSSVKLMTAAVKIFAILLAVICLINLALLNFKERTREIATMKVLGFSLPEIGRSLIYEVLILTVVGSCIGLTTGFPLLYLILSINQNAYVSFLYYISPGSYILGVALAIITSFVVNLLLSLSINRVPMVESLKSVE